MVKTKNLKGFTLAELLVVMMILGILMGLGWRGLATLKREYTLQTAAENIQELLREARNLAFTSSMVSGSGGGGNIQWVYGYVVRFGENGYAMYQMTEGLALDDLNDATLEAYWASDGWIEGGTIYENNEDLSVEVTSDCGQIGFSSVNGQMILPGGGGTCNTVLSLGGSERTIEVNSATGDILIY